MLVICNEAHRFLVQDQLAEVGVAARIVLEPAGRSTAAAVAENVFMNASAARTPGSSTTRPISASRRASCT